MKKHSLLIAGLALLLAGCSGGSDTAGSTTTSTGTSTTTSTTTPKALKIAIIGKETANPVFKVAVTGAQKAAEELSKSGSVPVTIDNLTPPKADGEEQAKRIAEAVTNGDNAVLISCSDAAKVKGAINDAVDKGVTVMTFDSDCADSKRFAFYGADDAECGTEVMEELAKQLGGKGSIAILAGTQTAPNLQKRVEAVKEDAKKYPGISIVTTAYHVEDPASASSKVTEVMHAYPQINGWAMIGGWPLFASSLLTELDPSKVKVVAVDGLPLELPYVEKGIAPVLLAQPIFEWGHTSVKMIYDKMVNHKTIPVINKMPLVRVTKDNLGSWANTLQSWGLSGIDPKYLSMKDTTPAASSNTTK